MKKSILPLFLFLFCVSGFSQRLKRETSVPISIIKASEIESLNRNHLDVQALLPLGDVSNTSSVGFRVRGVHTFNKTIIGVDRSNGAVQALPETGITDEMVDQILANLESSSNPKISINAADIQALLLEKYNDSWEAGGENIDSNIQEYINTFASADGGKIELSENYLKALAFYLPENSTTEVPQYFTHYELTKFTYSASVQWDFYSGKTEKFSGGGEYKYKGFNIASLNGGVTYHPCTSGGIELNAGPALELYDGGSDIGLNMSFGGYYNLKTVEDQIAEQLLYKQPSTVSIGISGGFNYYNIGGRGFTSISLGARLGF